MFTDLIDSTGLADSMDPEDFRVLIEAHRTIVVAPIARYGGTVARYLGDGMLVLFGYPEAHEDDPERAVRAGLEVAKATAGMNDRWVGEGKGRIAVRIGVHTGIVVVGDVLKADVKEIMAVFGNAPSIASRLQALAKPNGVVLSGATKALLPPAIVCETRGSTILKGMSRPVEIFSALEVREGQGDRRPAGRMLPFVNREKELAIIRRRWAAARRGEGQCLIIEGEPGIGKSRLIRAVEERIITQPSRWLITRTSPYAANTDFYAFAELFRHVLTSYMSSDKSFARLEQTLKSHGIADPDMALGLAGLLSIAIPDRATATPLQPERARELTLRAIAAWLQHEASRQPLVLVVEDLHWADASTLEAIERVEATLASHPVLLVCTTRGATFTPSTASHDGAIPAGAAVVSKAESAAQPSKQTPASPAGAASTLRLERLGAGYAEDLLGHVLQGVELPKAAVTTLLERANGVPLYLEELPKPVLEADGGSGASVTLPATLRDSLMAQLDGMGEAKAVAQTASVLGHSFERPLLEHVWQGDFDSLTAGLDALADAALIRSEEESSGASFGFRHALLAEIAYDSLLRDNRRRIHQRTAEILARHFQPFSESRPEILARHHEAAGDHMSAFECWLKAGKAAAQRSANAEALGHFSDAEAVIVRAETVDSVGDIERWLSLYLARGPVLISVLGWAAPEVESNYRQALKISRRLDLSHRDKFRIWGGLFNVYLLRGDLADARRTMERSHRTAAEANDPELLISSHRSLGLCSALAGQFDESLAHMTAVESSISRYPLQEDRQTTIYGTNPYVITYSIKAWCYFFKGNSQTADRWCRKAINVAQSADHPFSLCYALCLGSSLAQFQGRAAQALKLADRALEISTYHGFPYWDGWAKIVRGWALGRLGDSEAGLVELRDGLAEYRSTGAAQMQGYGLSLLASAYNHAGKWCEAVNTAENAVAEMDKTGIIFYRERALRLLDEARLTISRSNSGDSPSPPSK